MKLLGIPYSEKIDHLWSQLCPSPLVCEYRNVVQDGPRFCGMHVYSSAVGDSVILSVGADEYTVAHELMHVVLRREGYPHLGFRLLGLDSELVHEFTQYLESCVLHPLLNARLATLGIKLPEEYTAIQLNGLEASHTTYVAYKHIYPEYISHWALRILEMDMWGSFAKDHLRGLLKSFPEAWALVDELFSKFRGIETGSPEQCRLLAIEAVKIIDQHLRLKYDKGPSIFLDRITFPPPPLVGNPEEPAKHNFEARLTKQQMDSFERWELEISSARDGTLCWSEGFGTDSAEDQFVLVRTALEGLGTQDFADFCERLFTTIVF